MKKGIILGALIILAVGISLTATLLLLKTNQKPSRKLTAENVVNGIRFAISLDKSEFHLGEVMTVSLSVTNERDENFSFDTVTAFDFFVYDENFQEIYWWSIDKVFIEVIIEVTLRPSESYSETLDWDLNLYDPKTGRYTPIAPGKYHIRGSFQGMMTPPLPILVT